jgi:hypothetical protein
MADPSPRGHLHLPRHAAPQPPTRGWLIPAALCLLALSVWVHRRKLITAPRLLLDDFPFLIESRDLPATWHNAFTPHNAHVVPAFRFLTALARHAAGPCAAWPITLAWAAWLGLALCALLAARLVLRETASPTRALLAGSLILLSSTLEPVAAWWAGSQVTWCGAAILAALASALAYSRTGRSRWLVACVLSALLAPWVWSGGYLAWLAIPLALLADPLTPPNRKHRRTCLAALALALLAAAGVHLLAIGSHSPELSAPAGPSWFLRAARVPINTTHALCEGLLLPNLGLDASLDLPFALGLLLIAACMLLASAKTLPLQRTPLALAGTALILGGYVLVYAFRSDLGWPALRPIVWYHGLPQIGLVLLLIGGWKRPPKPLPDSVPRPAPARSLALLALIVPMGFAWLALQDLRIARIWTSEADTLADRIPAPVAETAARMPTPLRAETIQRAYARAQLLALRKLDIAQILVDRHANGPAPPSDLWLGAFPGWPPMLENHSASDLLRTPRSRRPPIPLDRFRTEFTAELDRRAPLDPAAHPVP